MKKLLTLSVLVAFGLTLTGCFNSNNGGSTTTGDVTTGDNQIEVSTGSEVQDVLDSIEDELNNIVDSIDSDDTESELIIEVSTGSIASGDIVAEITTWAAE